MENYSHLKVNFSKRVCDALNSVMIYNSSKVVPDWYLNDFLALNDNEIADACELVANYSEWDAYFFLSNLLYLSQNLNWDFKFLDKILETLVSKYWDRIVFRLVSDFAKNSSLKSNSKFLNDKVNWISSDYLYVEWKWFLERDDCSNWSGNLLLLRNLQKHIFDLKSELCGGCRCLIKSEDEWLPEGLEDFIGRFAAWEWSDDMYLNDDREVAERAYKDFKQEFDRIYESYLDTLDYKKPIDILNENMYLFNNDRAFLSKFIESWRLLVCFRDILRYLWVLDIWDISFDRTLQAIAYAARADINMHYNFIENLKSVKNKQAYLTAFFSMWNEEIMWDALIAFVRFDWSEWILTAYELLFEKYKEVVNSWNFEEAGQILHNWKRILMTAFEEVVSQWNFKTEEYIEKFNEQITALSELNNNNLPQVEDMEEIPWIEFNIVKGGEMISESNLEDLFLPENFKKPDIINSNNFAEFTSWFCETVKTDKDEELLSVWLTMTAEWLNDKDSTFLFFKINWVLKGTYKIKKTEDWFRHWMLYTSPDVRWKYWTWKILKRVLQEMIPSGEILFWEALLDNFNWIHNHIERSGWIWTKLVVNSKTPFLYLAMSSDVSQEYFSKYDTKDSELKREDFEQMTWVEVIDAWDISYLEFCLERWGVVTRVLRDPDSFVVEFYEERAALSRLNFELEKPLGVDDDFEEKIAA